jgi:hypothetical protein
VVDLTDSDHFNIAHLYLEKIYQNMNKSKILLILLNKIDLIRASINLKTARDTLIKEIEDNKIVYLNTSILIPETIEKVRKTIGTLLE